MSTIAAFAAGCAAAGAVVTMIYLMDKRRLKVRIGKLTSYLEAVNSGSEQVLSRCEDELSILEDEICKTVGELRIANEQSQSARQRQADNLADIAHQIKTPITSMSLMAELLSDGAGAEQTECIERLLNQIVRLEQLTAALLTMSRLDAGAIIFAKERVQFDELMARASEPVENILKMRKQELLISGKENILLCDTAWTAEALLNLVKNCSEHISEGGRINAECTVTPLYTQIVLEDDGAGFAAADLPKLFNRFYRGTDASPDSIGIGLSLTRSIIEEQGGLIRAENRREGGARFIIKLYQKA